MEAVIGDVLDVVRNQADAVSRRFSLAAHRWLTATSTQASFAAEVRADTWATALTMVILPTLGKEFGIGLDPFRIAQDVWKAAGKKDFDSMLIHERVMKEINDELAAL